MAIQARQFDQPDEVVDLGGKGRSEVLNVNDLLVVRSILEPGWSWVEHVKPMNEGLESCPLHHRETVLSGMIRYDMDDGGSVEAGPGTYLDIEPGHLAAVVGGEPCVVIDWGEDWG
ncbi:MAG TPA: cupin [Actinomycetota bacterium]|nr:cupin [Actinomycetota bacterium]